MFGLYFLHEPDDQLQGTNLMSLCQRTGTVLNLFFAKKVVQKKISL